MTEVEQIIEKSKSGAELTDLDKETLRQYKAAQTATKRPTCVDSMAAAAGVTGIPEPVLKKIKADNCGAFRGSRIYIDELDTFLESNPLEKYTSEIPQKEYFEIEIAKERRRKLKLENDIEEGLYLKRETVSAEIYALGKQLQTVLRRVLENELPIKLAGRSVEVIKPVMRATVDDICRRFEAGTSEWK